MGRGTIHPGATLGIRRIEDTLRALHGLDIEIGDIGIAVGTITRATGKLKTNLEVIVQHHLVFPQATLTVKDAEDPLLCLHAAIRAAPGLRVVAAVIAATGDGAGLGGIFGDRVGGADDGAGGVGRGFGGFVVIGGEAGAPEVI